MMRAFSEACDTSSLPVWLTRKGANAKQPYEAYLTSKTDHYCITINPDNDYSDFSVTHECFHVTMNEEGFPWGWLRYDDAVFENNLQHMNLIGAISNSLHHPEIYRRMSELYGPDMSLYWERERGRYSPMIDGWHEEEINKGLKPERKALGIIFVFYTFLVPELSQLAKQYKTWFPEEAAVCEKIRDNSTPLDTASKEGIERMVKSFQQQLTDYFTNKLPQPFAELWSKMKVGPLSAFRHLLPTGPCEC